MPDPRTPSLPPPIVRSLLGHDDVVGVALVGMSRMDHVRENMKVAARAPAAFEEFIRLFRKD